MYFLLQISFGEQTHLYASLCPEYLQGHVMPWAGNLMEEKSCVLNEISSPVIMVPLVCSCLLPSDDMTICLIPSLWRILRSILDTER
jgi:hypothetical protein